MTSIDNSPFGRTGYVGKIEQRSLMPVTKQRISLHKRERQTRIVMMQHALRDTAEFLDNLSRNGFLIDAFLAKPNSIEEEHLERISTVANHVIEEPDGTPPYQWYEEVGNLDRILQNAVQGSQEKQQDLVIIDVGGYFAAPLTRLTPQLSKSVSGVCEVTSFGHRRYLEMAKQIQVPIMSIARSPIKRAEAVFVGDTVVQATEDILREEGSILRGRKCGVLGFGMIASEIARSLQKRGLSTVVFDPDPLIALQAGLEGFQVACGASDVLPQADVLFSATGTTAIGFSDLRDFAKDGVILVSGGSRANEFAVAEISEKCSNRIEYQNSTSYFLKSGKEIRILNRGKAVNFLKSGTPEEVMDLVFAELFGCVENILNGFALPGSVTELDQTVQCEIADAWLGRNQRLSKTRDFEGLRAL